ncbi:hypothetical protein LMG24235_00912 [Paraburkholderia sabiae]|nr:hypothetical protein LMG24235_00912 [Paraburkholderia sabiae]
MFSRRSEAVLPPALPPRCHRASHSLAANHGMRRLLHASGFRCPARTAPGMLSSACFHRRSWSRRHLRYFQVSKGESVRRRCALKRIDTVFQIHIPSIPPPTIQSAHVLTPSKRSPSAPAVARYSWREAIGCIERVSPWIDFVLFVRVWIVSESGQCCTSSRFTQRFRIDWLDCESRGIERPIKLLPGGMPTGQYANTPGQSRFRSGPFTRALDKSVWTILVSLCRVVDYAACAQTGFLSLPDFPCH